MLSFSTTFAALALTLSAASISAAPIARGPTPVALAARAQPSGWATGYLEEYDVYHVRYMALDCQDQHNTTFFSDCCHPLLSTETLASRPAECTPSTDDVSSASEVIETATTTASVDVEADDLYCDEATSVAAEVSSVAASIAATATESVSIVTITSSVTASASGTVSATASAVVQTIAVQQDLVQATASSTSTEAAWTATSTSVKAKHTKASTSSTDDWTSTSTSTSAPAATTTASSGGGSGETYTGGYATYFYQNGVAGECGTVHSDSDYVIAIDSNGWWADYQTNAASPYCGKSILITNPSNGNTVTAVVADVCPTCVSNNSLDLSVAAFTALADESVGTMAITWQWV